MTTKTALTSHFNKAIATGTAAGRDGVSPKQFERSLKTSLIVLNHKVRSSTIRFAAYQQILKSKGANKAPREIALPIVRDRILLRAMSETLKEIDPSTSIELAQSKIARVIDALATGSYSHYLKLDVINFYPSIKHDWLRAVLKKSVRNKQVEALFMAATETPTLTRNERYISQRNLRGVPQGLAISNGLAELAVLHVDHSISAGKSLAYFRYVDDVLILTQEDRDAELRPKMNLSLALAGLTAHRVTGDNSKSASGVLSDGFEFLGYRFEWPRVSVRHVSVNRLESSIARTFTRYKYALSGAHRTSNWPAACEQKLLWHLNLIISGCVFEGNRLGWLAYFSQIRHHQLLEHLDLIVQKQLKRHKVSSIAPKTFVDSYRFAATRRPDTTGFVPNFDDLSVAEMKKILARIFFLSAPELKRLTSDEIISRFRKKIRGLAIELERDIQAGY